MAAQTTEVVTISATAPDPPTIARAAELLHAGCLVAFPTETVYGLGAIAFDEKAVARIFTAKGRPARNPVIVHIADQEDVGRVAARWPEVANRLARRFWPGSLTLVAEKQPAIPGIVTAEGPTVALRMPDHAVARALIRAAQGPIAAPSANRSTRLSPTRAEHVRQSLDGRIAMILDAGPTCGGLESTVLDVTCSPPRLLRPGLVTVAAIEELIGPIARSNLVEIADRPARSPGLQARHYAPRAAVECVDGDGAGRVEELRLQGLQIGWLTFDRNSRFDQQSIVRVMPREPADYAAQLYAVFHDLDGAGVERIVVEIPPAADEWLAVRDRLLRASSK